jgi:hypothetical protein
MVLSTGALMLEEISFHVYPGFRNTVVLFCAALVENLGYRQLTSLWRVIGLFRWLSGGKGQWGDMKRVAGWTSQAESGQRS